MRRGREREGGSWKEREREGGKEQELKRKHTHIQHVSIHVYMCVCTQMAVAHSRQLQTPRS